MEKYGKSIDDCWNGSDVGKSMVVTALCRYFAA